MAEKNSSEEKPPEFAPREYQLELLETAIKKNIIVCLGTGTGKTFISIKLIEHLAREHDIFQPFSEGGQRTFFLVNSVPLVFQQAEAIKRHTALEVKAFCGEMGVDFWSKDDWMEYFEKNHVLVMTHQIYLDLLQHAKIKLSQANLLVFDECHHANKNHPFKKIMDIFAHVSEEDHPRILGLTASVVGKKVKPFQIPSEVKRLERTMRCSCATASDPDVVQKYGAKPNEVFERYLSSRHGDGVAEYLESEFRLILGSLEKFLNDVKVTMDLGGNEGEFEKKLSVSKWAVRECLAALDEIGIWATYEVSLMLVDDLEKQKKKVRASLSPAARFASLILEVTLTSLREVHGVYNEFQLANQSKGRVQQEFLKPKVKKLLELYRRSRGDNNICSIIFVERRYAACVVSKLINQLAETEQDFEHLKSNFVTGHGADLKGISATEMKFTEQNKTLQKFRKGDFNVLVGTSVVEEGVDIPKCNLVVMFDFPKNYRAFVQSRGRGRAKDARYVLLMKQSEYEDKKQEQEMYHGIDEYLTSLCKRDRALPTDEEANDVVNVDLLDAYYTDIDARVNMGSAIGLLYRYCSSLPSDRFSQLKPKFTINDVGEQYQCTLQMPRNSLITGLIQGDPMPNKKQAKEAVAQKACEELHKKKALNDNLLPHQVSSDSESEDCDETDGSKAKTGTKKRQREHKVKVAEELEGELRPYNNKKMYVYAIKMKVVNVFEDKKSKTKKRLWDRKKHVFGIVTNKKLPKLPSFPLYHEIGKVDITLKHYLTLNNLNSEQLQLIDWFHEFIFSETLEFPGSFAGTGCRVVLLSSTNLQSFSSKRTLSPVKVAEINFKEMETLKKGAEDCTGTITSATDLNDAIVVAKYRPNQANYLVTAVDTELNPCSRFPEQSKGRTYKEYFQNRYNLRIKDDSQPLLQIVHFSREIDCRHRKPLTSLSTRFDEERLIPETLFLKKSPQSIALRASLLPSVLYRVHGLLSMIELRNTISTEAGIGVLATTSSYNSEEVSPCKKFKLYVMPNEVLSDASSDGEDMHDAKNSFQSSLAKYFHPFDRSRSVPLFNLLEAFTCSSSADAFDLERLEMLGDSFLKMAVSIYVYWHENHKDEGKLTKYRTRQISNKNLFKLAIEKDLPGYVKYQVLSKSTWAPPGYTLPDTSEEGMSDGEVNGYDWRSCVDKRVVKQKIPDKSIADSVEAVIGAHLTHCGYVTALKFMTWLGLEVLPKDEDPVRYKSDHYADYPLPTFEIRENEDQQRFQEILVQQTKEMAPFEKQIGYVFKHKVLLLEAFTHPTYSDNTITGSYQRLEFLGDAILDFLVTQYIYNHCSEQLTPGKLTDLRSALVNNNIFATIAIENNYQKYLKEYSPQLFVNIERFEKGVKEYQEDFENKVNPDPYVIAVQDDASGVECIEAPKPLGDVFESVAGAIFVDSGLDIHAVWKVCYPMLEKFIDEYSKNVPVNPVRAVMEFDNGAKFGHASETEDGQVSCELTFTDERVATIGQKVFLGVGRNKHNAKLSASYKAMKIIKKRSNNNSRLNIK